MTARTRPPATQDSPTPLNIRVMQAACSSTTLAVTARRAVQRHLRRRVKPDHALEQVQIASLHYGYDCPLSLSYFRVRPADEINVLNSGLNIL